MTKPPYQDWEDDVRGPYDFANVGCYDAGGDQSEGGLFKNPRSFGRAVREARLRRGWTRADMLEASGFKLETLVAFEEGKVDVEFDELMKFAVALNVDPSDLCEDLIVGDDTHPDVVTHADIVYGIYNAVKARWV